MMCMAIPQTANGFPSSQNHDRLWRHWRLWLIGFGAVTELIFWLWKLTGGEGVTAPALVHPWGIFAAMGVTTVGLGLAATADRESPFGSMVLGLFPIAGPLGYLAWTAVDQWCEMQQTPTRITTVIRLAVGLVIACGILFMGVGVLFSYVEARV